VTTSRRSLTLNDKLHGRLAMLDVAGTANRALGLTEMRQRYGAKLAALVERGNKQAITLVSLLRQRQHQSGSQALLEDIEKPIAKLSQALGLGNNDAAVDMLELMQLAESPRSFNSLDHFKRNLTEGLLLNVTALASRALSIPSGEYVVWMVDPGHTMLVPTNEHKAGQGEVLSERPDQYDIMTPDLLSCWNKVERVLSEGSQ
jgi:hypothetical protein